jgi:2-polyprenyl-6-hydroxyphenyl methylase / 3-demethylubiquinone-9 3-methyltransferase
MEVVEHVSNLNLFIENCSKLNKKKGLMIVATINKNLKSYMFGIIGAEYILRWLPIGTHDWNKFLTPQDLENIVINNNFLADETVGVEYNLLSNKWNLSSDVSVNYISTFKKN